MQTCSDKCSYVKQRVSGCAAESFVPWSSANSALVIVLTISIQASKISLNQRQLMLLHSFKIVILVLQVIVLSCTSALDLAIGPMVGFFLF